MKNLCLLLLLWALRLGLTGCAGAKEDVRISDEVERGWTAYFEKSLVDSVVTKDFRLEVAYAKDGFRIYKKEEKDTWIEAWDLYHGAGVFPRYAVTFNGPVSFANGQMIFMQGDFDVLIFREVVRDSAWTTKTCQSMDELSSLIATNQSASITNQMLSDIWDSFMERRSRKK